MLLANCPTAISIKYIQDNFKSAILLKVWHNGPLPLEARKKIGGIEVKPNQLPARFDPVNCALLKPRVY